VLRRVLPGVRAASTINILPLHLRFHDHYRRRINHRPASRRPTSRPVLGSGTPGPGPMSGTNDLDQSVPEVTIAVLAVSRLRQPILRIQGSPGAQYPITGRYRRPRVGGHLLGRYWIFGFGGHRIGWTGRFRRYLPTTGQPKFNGSPPSINSRRMTVSL
jgi:hypothetical protein